MSAAFVGWKLLYSKGVGMSRISSPQQFRLLGGENFCTCCYCEGSFAPGNSHSTHLVRAASEGMAESGCFQLFDLVDSHPVMTQPKLLP